jgi:pimeloyl-ACP methyl ester carboxylesterase
MPEIELPAGTIDYEDTGGDGPVVVLVPGLAMDGTLYRDVVADLGSDHRCVIPTLPLGSHRHTMLADADLSPRGIGRLEADFIEALDLRDVTLVGNDSGLFQFTAAEHPERIARLVITACEAFENFPPGLPGKNLWLAARLPGGLAIAAGSLRIPVMRRSPLTFGSMSRRPIPRDIMDGWLGPLISRKESRGDLRRYLRSAKKGDMMAAADGLRSFDRPVMIVWGKNDRMMPPAHGRRFAELIPGAHLVELDDCRTLIPIDQPAALAEHLRAFVATGAPAALTNGA